MSTRTPALAAARLPGLAGLCSAGAACHRVLDLDEPQGSTNGDCAGRAPNRDAPATEADSGGGFARAVAGPIVVSACVDATGQKIEQTGLTVRPGVATYAVMEPSP